MATPFTKYLEIKDNYCIGYFGENKDILKKILTLRDCAEKELKGIKIFIACKDDMKQLVHGRRNIVLESQMLNLKGKVGCQYDVADEQDLKNMTKGLENFK